MPPAAWSISISSRSIFSWSTPPSKPDILDVSTLHVLDNAARLGVLPHIGRRNFASGGAALSRPHANSAALRQRQIQAGNRRRRSVAGDGAGRRRAGFLVARGEGAGDPVRGAPGVFGAGWRRPLASLRTASLKSGQRHAYAVPTTMHAPKRAVIPRHRVSPSASPMTGSCGASSTPRLFDSVTDASKYWIARFRWRRQLNVLRVRILQAQLRDLAALARNQIRIGASLIKARAWRKSGDDRACFHVISEAELLSGHECQCA